METERTVAVVDDDLSIRRFIVHVLTRAGYRTIEASNGIDAKALIETQASGVALLIADIRMPGGNGLDLAVDLEGALPAMPVLYISGLIDCVAVQSIFLRNPLAILAKPFTASELVERVRVLIGPAASEPTTTSRKEPMREKQHRLPKRSVG
jgi:DNA-binding NtrC family response regulator